MKHQNSYLKLLFEHGNDFWCGVVRVMVVFEKFLLKANWMFQS